MKKSTDAPWRCGYMKAITLIVVGFCGLLLLTCANCIAPAAYGLAPVETVSHDQWVARQPLAIQNLNDWERPYVVDSNTTVWKTYATRSSYDPGAKDDLTGTMQDRKTFVHGDMFNNKVAQQDKNKQGWGALVLEFPELTTKWDTGWVTVRYPYVGTYKDGQGQTKKIGADVSYWINYVPDKTFTAANQYPVLQCANSLYSGITQYNVNSCTTTVKFIEYGTLEPVDIQGCFFTIGSLTQGIDAGGIGEAFAVSDSYNTSKIQLLDGSSVTAVDNNGSTFVYGTDAPLDFVDSVTAPTFWKLSASAFQNSNFKFRTYGAGWNLGTNNDTNLTVQWWSLSSATGQRVIPESPIKTVDKAEAMGGDTLTYTVSQQVKELGVDDFGTYESFVFEDPLPVEVSYVEGSAKVFKVENGNREEITQQAGTASFEGKTVRFTFSKDYLAKEMTCNGETYEFQIQAKVNAGVPGATIVNNNANTLMDGYVSTSNKVETLINRAALALDKTAEKSEWRVGDNVEYRITVSNTTQGTVARNVVVTDESLPLGLSLSGVESVSFEGSQEAVSVPALINGTLGWEDKPNNTQATAQGTGFKANIAFVAYGKPITLVFHATAQEEVNGCEVENTALATADNFLKDDGSPDSATDTAKVWINTPQLAISKQADRESYGVGDIATFTLQISNHKTGTVGRDLTVTDALQTQGVTLQKSSIVVMNSEGEVISPVKLQVKNNSFTVETGLSVVKDSPYSLVEGTTKTEQQAPNPLNLTEDTLITIEYQVVIVDADLAGKDIINTASAFVPETSIPATTEQKTPIEGPLLQIEKTADKSELFQGEANEFTLAVHEMREDATAKNVCVSDSIAYEGAAIDKQSIVCTLNGQIFEPKQILMTEDDAGFTVETGRDLPFSDKLEIRYTVRYADAPPGKVINTALATSDNTPPASDTATVVVRDPNEIPPKFGHEVTVYKAADPSGGSLVASGDDISYTLTAVNTGTTVAPFTVIRDYIPEGTSYVPDSTGPSGTFVAAVEGEHEAYVEFIVLNLKPHARQSVGYHVSVADPCPTWIRNTALYGVYDDDPGEAGSITKDPPFETNEIIHTTDKDSPVPAVLDLEKESDPLPGTPVFEGDVLTYSLTLYNNGGSNAQKAGIRDYLPQGTSYVQDSATEGGLFDEKRNCVDWHIESLSPGESITVSFSVTVIDTSGGNIIENQALFEDNWTGQTDPGNTSNIVAHPAAGSTLEPEGIPGEENPVTAPQDSLVAGLAKTGDWVKGNLWIVLPLAAGVALVAVARLRTERRTHGYMRYKG